MTARQLALVEEPSLPVQAPSPIEFDPAKPVRLRNGLAARIIATDKKTFPYGGGTIVALISYPNGDTIFERIECFLPDGRLFEHKKSRGDLVNIKPVYSRWANVYKDGSIMMHDTKEEADATRPPNCAGLVEYTFKGDKVVKVKLHKV